jgi:hypothetical protein
MSILRIVALGASVALYACEMTSSRAASTSTVDSAGVRITTITSAPSSAEEWTVAPTSTLVLIGAETGDSAAFALVGGVRWLSDGRLVVADVASSRLLVFDSAGRFVRALGRRGDGPGEFRSVGSLTARPGDSLVTFDPSMRRLSIWHADSGFVRGIQLEGNGELESWPADAWLWQDSLIVVLQLSITPQDSVPPGAGVRKWPMRARLTLRDPRGVPIRASPVFDAMYTGLYAKGDVRLPFSNQPFASIARDRVYYGSGSDFSIQYLNRDFIPAGELRWPAQQEALSAGEVDRVRSEARALLATRLPPERVRNALTMEFATEILPATRPAIGRLLVVDGQLWVERFEATRLGSRLQKPGDRWTILSERGEPVARLSLPPDTRLEDVRGGRLALVARDSLDVQTVVVRELRTR